MNAIEVFGYVLELAGFVCAAWGLQKTWKENAQGRPFPILDRAWQWLRVKLLRRPGRETTFRLGTATVHHSAGTVTLRQQVPLTPEMSINDQIAALARNIDYVADMATAAHDRVGKLDMRNVAELGGLRADVQGMHTSLTRQDSDLAIRGIPLAAFGLVLATVGLLLQAIGSAI